MNEETTVEYQAAGLPDIFDLNDWLLTVHPDVHQAMRLLHASTFYDSVLEIWKKEGSPDIDDAFAQDDFEWKARIAALRGMPVGPAPAVSTTTTARSRTRPG